MRPTVEQLACDCSRELRDVCLRGNAVETESGHCDTGVAVSQDVLRIVAGVSGGTLKGNAIELVDGTDGKNGTVDLQQTQASLGVACLRTRRGPLGRAKTGRPRAGGR